MRDNWQAMTITYQQAFDYIHSFDDPYLAALRNHGKQTWGLEGIRQLLDRLGSPHLAYPTIHVAGTKGKGSTAAFITQGLIESGLRTGLYISPHLQEWRERIQVNRQEIAPEALARLVEDIRPHADGMPLSAFEITTALALWHFAREGCDAAVIEVGLGGRLDATSVVEPIVAVITNISRDHMQLLGDTLGEIAGEKAAIIKPGVPVVSAPQPPEALTVIEEQATNQGSPLILVGRDWQVEVVRLTWEGSEALIGNKSLHRYRIGLAGAFQVENAAVALAALDAACHAGLPITQAACEAALAGTRWPGRLEIVSRRPLIVLDGAHNVHSMQRLVESIEHLRRPQPTRGAVVFVFGCMADKEVGAMLQSLLPITQRVILTAAQHVRAASPDDLLTAASEIIETARGTGADWADQISLKTAPDIASAIHMARQGLQEDDLLCITGSLSIAGEARDELLGLPVSTEDETRHTSQAPHDRRRVF